MHMPYHALPCMKGMVGHGIGMRLAAKFHFTQNDGFLYSRAFSTCRSVGKTKEIENRLVRFTPDLHLENDPNLLVKYKREAGKGSEAKVLAMTYWMAMKYTIGSDQKRNSKGVKQCDK